jgi:hypothetical protein
MSNVRWLMHWLELSIAVVFAALFTGFQFFPGGWCEPLSVKLVAGVFVVVSAMLYLWFVDDERRPKAGARHRLVVGGSTGLIVAAIAGGQFELHALLALIGVASGYVGFRWLKHVPF